MFTYCILIGESKKVKNVMFNVIIFDVVHQVRSISFNLFRGRHGTEYNFCKALTWKHPKTNTPNGPSIFN